MKSGPPVDDASTSLANITLQDSLLKKVDVVARVCNCLANDCHLFQNVWMYTGLLKFKRRTLIDCQCPFNLISQSIIKHYSIPGSNNDVPLAKDLNSGGIKLFRRHRIVVKAKGNDSSQSLDAIDVYSANITGCKLILGLDWLKKAQPAINWGQNSVYYKPCATVPEYPKETAKIWAQIKGLADVNDASNTSPDTPSDYSSDDYFDRSPVMACVGLEKLAEICDAEGTEAYLVTWKNVTRLFVERNAKLLISAILGGITDEE